MKIVENRCIDFQITGGKFDLEPNLIQKQKKPRFHLLVISGKLVDILCLYYTAKIREIVP